ncbi:MAG: hypothetical protein QXX68_01225 [Candidatus Pacearchaeota archaeon]
MASKEKILEQIKEMIYQKNPKLNKKAKILAMRNNIKLSKLRKEFCQKCFYPLDKAIRRVKKGFLVVHCLNCGNLARWKLKKE